MQGRPGTLDIQHGTRSRYVRGCRCRLCRNANTDYQQARAWRLGLKVPMAEYQANRPRMGHGTNASYQRGCRCDECSAAGSETANRAFVRQSPQDQECPTCHRKFAAHGLAIHRTKRDH